MKITADQIAILEKFKGSAGRTWKAQLRQAWSSGKYPDFCADYRADLQRIRNTVGQDALK